MGIDTSLDYYAMLGLKVGAGEEAIKKEFRSLARVYHPDSTAGKSS